MWKRALQGEIPFLDNKEYAMIACASNPDLYLNLTESLKRDIDIIYVTRYRESLPSKIMNEIMKYIPLDKVDLELLMHLFGDVYYNWTSIRVNADKEHKSMRKTIFENISPILRGEIMYCYEKTHGYYDADDYYNIYNEICAMYDKELNFVKPYKAIGNDDMHFMFI